MSFIKSLRVQMSLMISKKLFLFPLIVLFVFCAYKFFTVMSGYIGVDRHYALPASLAFILNWAFEGRRGIIQLVAIVCCIPFVSSYIEDSKSNLTPIMFTRTTSCNYYFSKLLSVFLSTFACIAIPLIINWLLCMSFFPVVNTHSDYTLSATYNVNLYTNSALFAFKNIHFNNMHIYNFIYTMIFSAFFGLLATLSCALSFFLEKIKYIVILVPFFLLELAQLIEFSVFGDTAVKDKIYFIFGDYILPQSYGLVISPWVFILYIVGCISATIGLALAKIRQEQVNSI